MTSDVKNLGKGAAQGGPFLRTESVRAYVARLGFRLGSEELARYLNPRLADLSKAERMADRAKAAARIALAVRENERVVVFGDYDCDGMTATAIMTEGLRGLGAKEVTPLLASRFGGGYGLSKGALERVLGAEPSLVVTCDCGSSDHESLRELVRRGIDVVVIDHHLVPDEPLPVLAFLNPHRPDCASEDKGLASCGLALSVLGAVRTELGRSLELKSFLDLVAIGTIADVAPLVGDNRALVRAGLRELGQSKRPGLMSLFEVIGLGRSEELRAGDVAFRIAPRLNAPGRLGSPDIALELLLERSPEKARGLAAEVERLCLERRALQETMETEALLDAEASSQPGEAIVVGRKGWNHGIVGIVAGRLAEKKKVPAIVIGFDGETGVGSVRGPAGFPLYDALSSTSSLLNRFGGHQAAAGLEVRHERLSEFREAFIRACAERSDFERPPAPVPCPLHPEDELGQVLDDLMLLEPCGEKNPAPVLSVRGTVTLARSVKGGHLKLELLTRRGQRLSGFGPGLGKLAEDLKGEVRALGSLRRDTFRGGTAVELLVSDVVAVSLASEATDSEGVS